MSKIQAYAITDVGKVRFMNQDYIFSSELPIGVLPNLFMVADGMGGHKAGDYASRFLVEQMVDYIRSSENKPVVSIIKQGIQSANERLYQLAQEQEELFGMGTTLVLAVIEQDTLYAANVGDSRLYLVRDGIRQVTRDHSYVEEMVALGRLERNSQDYLSKKNIITRAIGSKANVEVDFFEIDLMPGDYILLCSDGLTNMVSEEQMEEMIRSDKTIKEKVEQLVATANLQGGRDNIAAILVEPQTSEVSKC